MAAISRKQSTKDRIRQAAQRLFAEKGVDGTSMRDITDAAGVNLASVNYHFRSKDGLVSDVFRRYLTPINGVRLTRLDALETDADNHPLTLEYVLEAFIRPAVIDASAPHHHNCSFSRLMARCLSEPPAYTEKADKTPGAEQLIQQLVCFGAAGLQSHGTNQDY